jgi:hypothetical protein
MDAFEQFASKRFCLGDFVGEFETGAKHGDVRWVAVVARVDGGLLGGVCGVMLGAWLLKEDDIGGRTYQSL